MTDQAPIPIRGTTSILILDAQAIARHGLVHLLAGGDEFSICDVVAAPHEALRVLRKSAPDLLLLEVDMQDEGGLEFIRTASDERPSLGILVISHHDEALFAERTLRAGAHGFVSKDVTPRELVTAVRKVAAGGSYVSEKIRDRLVEGIAGGAHASPRHPLDDLTDRELQIFRLLGRGLSTREIADLLEISRKTVETHRANVMKKLDLGHASQLIHRAIAWTRFGILDEDTRIG